MTTQTEALKLALDGAANYIDTLGGDSQKYRQVLAQPEQERCVGCEACIDTACGRDECPKGWPKAAQPEQEPVAWKLVPTEPTDEMLKAMDECSTEGYDERLYAGHAASVYMAAVDVAPTPPQFKKPEQRSDSEHLEPVACVVPHGATMRLEWASVDAAHNAKIGPLYTTPPQRKPLAYVDLRRVANQCGLGANEVSAQAQAKVDNFARAIEAAHGIKE